MRYILSFILFFCGSCLLKAQQLPILSEYAHNGFILNPGMTGWEGITSLSAGYRHQWTGMPESPRTANLAFRHSADDLHMGYGGYFVHDQTGPTSFTGISLNYAYNIRFKPEVEGEYDRNRLSIGLSLSGLAYRLKGADLKYIDPDDALIIQNSESQFFPDAGMGLFYQTDLYYFGLSVPQIISMKVRFNDDLALSAIRRVAHFYMNGGAKIKLKGGAFEHSKHQHHIIPSFWLKFAPVSPLNFNMNVQYMYDNLFTAGIGYSTDGSIIGDFNILFRDRYRLGYAFSMNVAGLGAQLGSNHEFMLAYTIQSSGKGWFNPKVEGPNWVDKLK